MIESRAAYESLIESDDPSIRRRGITDTATAEVWFELLEHRPDLVVEVAFNKTLPDSVIEFLIKNGSAQVKHIVASKRRLSVSHFETLASDEDECVRTAIAFNNNTPFFLLKQLSSDPCERVSSAAQVQIREQRAIP